MKERYIEMLKKVASDLSYYSERHRPQFHFSPPEGWMNDPNGLVYFNGKYRMCFQHDHPYLPGKSWGSAVSTDLVHWQTLPPAILKDDLGDIFSGTAAVDWKDTSGFFDGKPGLVAMFTYNKSADVGQVQGLAYSCDGGDTWIKYEGNPIIPNYGVMIFIDPKIFWYEPTQRWVAFIGGHGYMRIYSSPNLREWQFESDVKEIGPGGEVADVFQLPVDGDTNNVKWVWSAGGSWFVVGSFDGKKIVPETDRIPFGAGPEASAAQSWSDMPTEDGRRIFIYWMHGNGKKRNLTSPWQCCMTLPRKLELVTVPEGGYRITQTPIRELQKLRRKRHEFCDITVKTGSEPLKGIHSNMLEIIAEFKLGSAKRFGLNVLKGKNEQTVIGYEVDSEKMFIDRSKSGYTNILDYARAYHSDLPPIDGKVKLHVFVDQSLVELFGNDGYSWMTAMVLPSPTSGGLELFAEDGEVELLKLDVYELKSIWHDEEKLPKSPVRIILSRDYTTIEVGHTTEVDALIWPKKASSRKLIWTSSAPEKLAIMAFSDTGATAKALAEGEATITAKTTDGGITAGCNVHIYKSGFVSNLTNWVASSDTAWLPMPDGIQGDSGQYVSESRLFDCVFEADVILYPGAIAGLSVRDSGNRSVSRRVIMDEPNGIVSLFASNSYVYTATLGSAHIDILPNQKYHLKIEAKDKHYKIFLDHRLIIDADDQLECWKSAQFPLLFVERETALFQNVEFRQKS